jgi:hypothetical protein
MKTVEWGVRRSSVPVQKKNAGGEEECGWKRRMGDVEREAHTCLRDKAGAREVCRVPLPRWKGDFSSDAGKMSKTMNFW